MQALAAEVGVVVQISPEGEDKMFAACLMVITEVFSWGVQGYVSCPVSRDEMPGLAFVRKKYAELEVVGRASWMRE